MIDSMIVVFGSIVIYLRLSFSFFLSLLDLFIDGASRSTVKQSLGTRVRSELQQAVQNECVFQEVKL